MKRMAAITRNTTETRISLELNLDGAGTAEISTGIGFFDHMLNSFARHGMFDLKLQVAGDLEVDCHHTIEDVGIVLGQAIKQAVGDKKSMKRYGSMILPMDETLVLCAVDLSGRPYFGYQAEFHSERIGNFDTEMIKEFFYAVSYSGAMNLHLRQLAGENAHHIAEGMFKAFARALDEATSLDARIQEVLSTKGSL
ncbi:imidazoleglycerol-phosphate dehydratase HisB [Cuneatibacter caecimuris]|uniref:Imidazoleglycerol-phosphate dehydratase n=1 Tax=Cuneatibacter caecimuris TaxID=1796618 RepID=A0A4Q7P0N0_9FIRM|nr:imidazoleglycerol-phosphate dehydratase HisB [Cuneatibacter caecimuris]RZS92910.1 imidazoleglycerol-phosphate dehydratase [Cuneatibacter caecimuris]